MMTLLRSIRSSRFHSRAGSHEDRMMSHCPTRHASRWVRMLAGVVALAAAVWLPTVHAQSVECTVTVSSLNFGTIYVRSNTPAGTQVGPAVTASATFSCTKLNGATQANFYANVAGSPAFDSPTAGTITFPTNLAGMALQLTPSNPGIAGHTATTFPAGTITSTTQTTQTYSAQLVTTTTNVAVGNLNQTLINSYSISINHGSSAPLSSASLAAIGTIKAGGCNILNVTVTLPTVSTAALNTAGMTAGNTPVPLNLTSCPANTNLSISFQDAAATGAAPPTVLASSGSATNVGVQLVDGTGNPVDVTGNVATPIGTTSATGNLSPSYTARYYATGAATGGDVKAKATYTLTYP